MFHFLCFLLQSNQKTNRIDYKTRTYVSAPQKFRMRTLSATTDFISLDIFDLIFSRRRRCCLCILLVIYREPIVKAAEAMSHYDYSSFGSHCVAHW